LLSATSSRELHDYLKKKSEMHHLNEKGALLNFDTLHKKLQRIELLNDRHKRNSQDRNTNEKIKVFRKRVDDIVENELNAESMIRSKSHSSKKLSELKIPLSMEEKIIDSHQMGKKKSMSVTDIHKRKNSDASIEETYLKIKENLKEPKFFTDISGYAKMDEEESVSGLVSKGEDGSKGGIYYSATSSPHKSREESEDDNIFKRLEQKYFRKSKRKIANMEQAPFLVKGNKEVPLSLFAMEENRRKILQMITCDERGKEITQEVLDQVTKNTIEEVLKAYKNNEEKIKKQKQVMDLISRSPFANTSNLLLAMNKTQREKIKQNFLRELPEDSRFLQVHKN